MVIVKGDLVKALFLSKRNKILCYFHYYRLLLPLRKNLLLLQLGNVYRMYSYTSCNQSPRGLSPLQYCVSFLDSSLTLEQWLFLLPGKKCSQSGTIQSGLLH